MLWCSVGFCPQTKSVDALTESTNPVSSRSIPYYCSIDSRPNKYNILINLILCFILICIKAYSYHWMLIFFTKVPIIIY